MSRRPRLAGGVRTLLPVALAGLVMGCGQGYPARDVALDSPFEMNQVQRVEALNRIGSEADDRQRWRYALHQACVLEVRQRGGLFKDATAEVRLDEITVETRPVADGAGPGVQLIAAGKASAPVTLLQSDGPRPAQQASLLVKLLKRDCAPGPAGLV